MSRHETRWWTEYSNGTETHTIACVIEGCGWEIAVDAATEAGAKRAAREHTEINDLRPYITDLKRNTEFLSALEASGVDNWEGYEIAQDMMKEENE